MTRETLIQNRDDLMQRFAKHADTPVDAPTIRANVNSLLERNLESASDTWFSEMAKRFDFADGYDTDPDESRKVIERIRLAVEETDVGIDVDDACPHCDADMVLVLPLGGDEDYECPGCGRDRYDRDEMAKLPPTYPRVKSPDADTYATDLSDNPPMYDPDETFVFTHTQETKMLSKQFGDPSKAPREGTYWVRDEDGKLRDKTRGTDTRDGVATVMDAARPTDQMLIISAYDVVRVEAPVTETGDLTTDPGDWTPFDDDPTPPESLGPILFNDDTNDSPSAEGRYNELVSDLAEWVGETVEHDADAIDGKVVWTDPITIAFVCKEYFDPSLPETEAVTGVSAGWSVSRKQKKDGSFVLRLRLRETKEEWKARYGREVSA